ncbi:histone deacetylase [Shewanella submarina]|uniref:Histone deacetylase n=1 Tax=Shewanella submarina TaxID=2016376 RepID=A0ABV7GCA4_9GAMM|nr:histone deacetylase [Shewanella submarina]MCL1036681.1 histone deacetylase [Shewanella submarina]
MIPLVYHASYSQLALPPNHRFPVSKYQHLRDWLMANGHAIPSQFVSPTPVNEQQLGVIHHPDYVHGFFNNQLDPRVMRRIGFPWSEQLLERTRHAVAGTQLAAMQALEYGAALHLSGGYHHAHTDFGSGFCVFNDLILAARSAIDSGRANKVLILDCDVHQGDGTAAMGQRYGDIITCSFHAGRNFPARKQLSDHDIEFADGCDDSEYLATVESVSTYLIRLCQPDLMLYDAGVDIHQDDDLGYLSVSTEGLYKRDSIILSAASEHNIPVAAVIGGGYSKDPMALTQRHSQLFFAANQIFG